MAAASASLSTRAESSPGCLLQSDDRPMSRPSIRSCTDAPKTGGKRLAASPGAGASGASVVGTFQLSRAARAARKADMAPAGAGRSVGVGAAGGGGGGGWAGRGAANIEAARKKAMACVGVMPGRYESTWGDGCSVFMEGASIAGFGARMFPTLGSMVHSALRWGLFIATIVIAGPLAYALMRGLTAVDGSHHVTALASATPVSGLIRAASCVALAALIGAAGSRFASLNTGLLCAGVVLAWAAAACGTVDEVLRAGGIAGASSALRAMAIEAVVLGGLTAGAVQMIVWCRPANSAAAPEVVNRKRAMTEAGVTITIAAVAGLVGSWLVAQNMLKGQAIATGALSAIIGAVTVSLIVRRSSPAGIMLGIALVAVIGPLAAMLTHSGTGATGAVAKAAAGTLIHVARLTPLDWMAGGLIGLPVGRSLALWFGEMTIKPEADAAATT